MDQKFNGDWKEECLALMDGLLLYKNLASEYGLSVFEDIAKAKLENETLRAKLATAKLEGFNEGIEAAAVAAWTKGMADYVGFNELVDKREIGSQYASAIRALKQEVV